ncbi:LemA family protein [Rickettsiales bacterium Ac37b]|nr:LemA family protein [Rickettsiales bacterium Ac37b]
MKVNYIIIAVAVVGLFWTVSIVNKLPTLDENVNAAISQIDNELKRRNDLIPNLLSVVKGYAVHEEEVFTEVTNARAKAMQISFTPELLNDPIKLKKFEEAQAQLSFGLSKLMNITENYPDLKSNQNFLSLQSQLEGTENRIAIARRDYILTIKNYNIALRTFPSSILAKLIYPDFKPIVN